MILNESKKLEDLLLKNIKFLKKLVESAEEKKNFIIHNKIDEIERITVSENYLIAQIHEIEEERAKLLLELSTEEVKLNQLKISEIANYFEPAAAARIIQLQKAAKTLILELKKRNARNQELLLFAIDYFNDFFQTLFAHHNPPIGYNQKGLQNQEVIRPTMFLDKRA